MRKSVIMKMEKLVNIATGTVSGKYSFIKSWLTEDHGLAVSVKWSNTSHMAELHMSPVLKIGTRQYVSSAIDVVINRRSFNSPLDAEQWAVSVFNEIYFVETGIEGYSTYGVDHNKKRSTPVIFKRVPSGILKIKTKDIDGKVQAFAIDTRRRERLYGKDHAREYNPYNRADLINLSSISDYSYELL